jgi:hypothetical protein
VKYLCLFGSEFIVISCPILIYPTVQGLVVREEHRLRALVSRLFKMMFGPKGE